jgi:hypothetical protein
MSNLFRFLSVFFLLSAYIVGHTQNIGINATGHLPDIKAMLDIASTNSGLLIPG